MTSPVDNEDEKPKKTKSAEIRHSTNPFVQSLTVDSTGKRVTVNVLGTEDNILVNQNTGEVTGTHISTFKRVDNEQFVKLFTKNIAMTFDLKAAGIKAFNVLLHVVQSNIGKDLVHLDQYTLDEFIADHESLDPPIKLKLSLPTFMRGLRELESAQIIAKSTRRAYYYINPSFVFNGDRIVFSTFIERNKTESLN